jgi:hypothetical protein
VRSVPYEPFALRRAPLGQAAPVAPPPTSTISTIGSKVGSAVSSVAVSLVAMFGVGVALGATVAIVSGYLAARGVKR